MNTKIQKRLARKMRVRAKISGTGACPRLTVFRSNKMLSGQLIDDEKGVTLVSAKLAGTSTKVGKELGTLLSAGAKKKKITTAVFDRNGYRYHGVVQAIADAAREGGLKI